jgi:hypothetical protein
MKSVAAGCLAIILIWTAVLRGASRNTTQPNAVVERCRTASFDARIDGAAAFQRELGENLRFHLVPLGEREGWTIEVRPLNSTDDYAYPLNPPLRMGNSQWLGTGYNDTAEQRLSYEHVVYFVLNAADYDKIMKLVQDALWPYGAAEPDKAGEQYLSALAKLPAGSVILRSLKYETENGGKAVNWMEFSVQIITPASFRLTSDLTAKEAACPKREL